MFDTFADSRNGSPWTASIDESGDFSGPSPFEAFSYAGLEGPQFGLNGDDRGGVGPNGKVSLTPGDAGGQITRSNFSWATGLGTAATVTFAFRGVAPGTMPTDTGGFTAFTSVQIAATLLALASWSDVANITFVRVTDPGSEYSGSASILFGNYSTGQGGAAAFAYSPGSTGSSSVSGDVWVNSSLSYNATPVQLGYGQQVLTHEIGHAIGLRHPADYNAAEGVSITYANDATYYEDSRQYTVMSYFSESNTGVSFSANGVSNYSSAPLLDDISAAQRLYGANMSTRTGDTVYGFNSTAGQVWYSAASASSRVIFCVWDAAGNDTLDFSGYTQAQTIDLRQGAFSSVGGLTGNVSIAMGAVVENAVGGSGADNIRGNSANNRIQGNAGNDNIDGGLGSDTVVFNGTRAQYTIQWNGQVGTVSGNGQIVNVTNVELLMFTDQTIAAAPTGGLIVTGDATNEIINGTSLSDSINGAGGNDVINGGDLNDNLNGGLGNDTVNGEAGDDTLIGGLGNDNLNGGLGRDIADYSGASGSIVANLATGAVTGAAGADSLISIEELRGTAFNDILTGSANNDTIRGGGGIDVINGGDGTDVLYAGAPGQGGGAPDIAKAQGTANASIGTAVSLTGAFDLIARAGVVDATTIPHATVVATTHGGVEYYAITVTAGETVNFDIDGAAFDSVLRILNGAGTELINNDDGSATGEGAGTDSFISYTFASAGTYYVQVSQWTSGAGATLVSGPPPAGMAYSLHVSSPSQTAQPIVFSGSTLNGGNGTDALYGEDGVDTLNGGEGSDYMDGGLGADLMTGGGGNDQYVVSEQGDLVFENANEGLDRVIASTGFYLYDNIEILTLAAGAGNIFGVGNDLANTLEGNEGENLLIAGAGNDTVSGGAGNDSLFGQDGNDTLNGDAGIDYIVGGIGNDTINGGADADALYGEDGDDLLIGGDGFVTDILVGGAGNDTLRADSGLGDYDRIDGGAGDDIYYVDTGDDLTFEAAGGGTDTVYADVRVANAGVYLYANVENLVLIGTTSFGVGNELNNSLVGNASGNYLLGGAGNDTINGKGGADVLFGEAGADVFVFDIGSGGDVIGDFARGTDRIDLRAFGFANFAQLSANFSQVGNDGAINLGAGDFIVLHGVTMSQLTAADFIFPGGSAPALETAKTDRDDAFILPALGKDGVIDGPQVIPVSDDDFIMQVQPGLDAKDAFAGPEVLPVLVGAFIQAPQTLPELAGKSASDDAAPQTLPGVMDDGFMPGIADFGSGLNADASGGGGFGDGFGLSLAGRSSGWMFGGDFMPVLADAFDVHAHAAWTPPTDSDPWAA